MQTKSVYFFAVLLSVCCVFRAKAQSEEVKNLYQEALELEDKKGDYDGAIKLLERASKEDPSLLDLKYEIAYAYYAKKDYENAKKLLKPLLKKDEATFQYYQLLGNAYDDTGEPDKAVNTYKEGLKRFPNEGHLYNELGILEMHRKNYSQAIDYWEKGIQLDPKVSSNYYWASRIYSYSDERIWAVMYGELFMNIERTTKRTAEISALLYKTYNDAYKIGDSGKLSISFTKNMVMANSDPSKFKLPFNTVYETAMGLCAASQMSKGVKTFNMDSYSAIRSQFINMWYTDKHNTEYANALLDWQKELTDKGYLEAYNHWLMREGNADEFDAWYKNHKESYDAFMTWFENNRMPVDTDHHFYRLQYSN